MIRRLFAGLGVSSAILVVMTLGQVVDVPIYLTRWGAQTYGEWLTLTSLASTASLLNLGVRTYAGNLLISAYAKRDFEGGTGLLRAALRLYSVLCSLALLLLLGLLAWPGMAARLKIEALSGTDARTILATYGLIYVYGILGGLLMSLFRATNQLPRQLTYGLVEGLIFLLAPAAVALAGGSPAAAALATGALFAAITLVEIGDVRRRTPFSIGWSGVPWRASWALLGPSVTFFVVTLAGQLLSTGMTIAISASIGAAAVAVYFTTLMLTNFVRGVVNQGMNVLWPEVTAAATLREQGRLLRWHRLALKLVGMFALAGGMGIGLLGPALLAIWTRGRIAIDPGLNWLFVVYLLVHAPGLVSGMFGLAMNRQSQLMRANLATAVAAVGLTAAIAPHLGLRGAALAVTLGQMAGTLWTLRLACDWTSDRLPALSLDVGLRSLPSLAAALLGAWLVSGVGAGLGVQILAAAGAAILVGLVGWWTWFGRLERALLTNLASGFLQQWVNRADAQGASA